MAVDNIFFVSGAEEKYFVMAGMLANSLALHYPDIPFLLMDMGLSEAQRKFAQRKGWLLSMPDIYTREKPPHPFTLKAAIGRYLEGYPDGTFIWIDSDIVAVAGGTEDILLQVSRMRKDNFRVAVTTEWDGRISVGDYIQRSNTPKFATAVEADGIGRELRYINSGVIFFLGKDLMESWRLKTEALCDEDLFEQNAFNIVAHEMGAAVDWIDPRTWNNHGLFLKDTRLDDGVVMYQNQPVRFLHATAASSDIFSRIVTTVPLANGLSLNVHLKMLTSPDLQQIQKRHLQSFIRTNMAMLQDCWGAATK